MFTLSALVQCPSTILAGHLCERKFFQALTPDFARQRRVGGERRQSSGSRCHRENKITRGIMHLSDSIDSTFKNFTEHRSSLKSVK